VASLERDNLVVVYYLSASDIGLDKRCGISWEDLIQGMYYFIPNESEVNTNNTYTCTCIKVSAYIIHLCCGRR
jgi:hypothetical protein